MIISHLRAAAFILAMALLSPPAAADASMSGHDVVSAALHALDAKHDVRKIQRLSFDEKSVSHDIVQGEHAGEPYIARMSAAAVTYDFTSGYRRTLTRAADGRFVARDLVVGNAEEVATINGEKVEVSYATLAAPAWEVRDPFHALILADRASDLRLEADASLHGLRQHVVSFALRGVRVEVFVDAQNHLITATAFRPLFSHATSSNIAWNALGDVEERTEFQLWDAAGSLRYPTQWDTYRNGLPLLSLKLDGPPTVDEPSGGNDQMAPDSLQKASKLEATDVNRIELGHPIIDAPDPGRGTAEIAAGVVQIPGSWFTTLVRQDDGIVIIDAPISCGYSAQVIAEAHRRFPGVPIKAVITSTAFFWHIAGIREYAANHIPIYVRDVNAGTVRHILEAPHTLAPDALAKTHMKPILRPVSERTVIGHGQNQIVVMPIRQAAEPMLMTYLPGSRILHTGEMIQPLGPGGAFLYPESLMEIRASVREEGLQVDRLIGMHMAPRPWSDLEAAIAANGLADS
jgi:hypothetical protein